MQYEIILTDYEIFCFAESEIKKFLIHCGVFHSVNHFIEKSAPKGMTAFRSVRSRFDSLFASLDFASGGASPARRLFRRSLSQGS